MKSITIHNLSERQSELITQKAQENGNSLNKTIKGLLNQALGITSDPENNRRNNFMDLFGTWDEEEYQEFEEQTKVFRKIDPADWK